MKITSKGQVTIPQALRDQFGFLPNTTVEFRPGRDGLMLVKPKERSGKGRRMVERLRGRGRTRLSTEELLKLTRSEV